MLFPTSLLFPCVFVVVEGFPSVALQAFLGRQAFLVFHSSLPLTTLLVSHTSLLVVGVTAVVGVPAVTEFPSVAGDPAFASGRLLLTSMYSVSLYNSHSLQHSLVKNLQFVIHLQKALAG
jgi:hypothetical protein